MPGTPSVAARSAVSGWAGATSYNRGQVLYRIAELLEGRRAQFVEEIRAGEGVSEAAAQRQVDAAIDVWVWYAGWADKYVQFAGNANPVAGPYFNISTPEPTGVVAVIAPQDSSLLGLVSVLAPGRWSAATRPSWWRASALPLSAISLSEILATSDVPAGVVNVLTGSAAEIAPWLASHADVNALDLAGAERAGLDRPADRGGGHPEARAAAGVRASRPPRCTGSPSSPRPRPSGTRRACSSTAARPLQPMSRRLTPFQGKPVTARPGTGPDGHRRQKLLETGWADGVNRAGGWNASGCAQ